MRRLFRLDLSAMMPLALANSPMVSGNMFCDIDTHESKSEGQEKPPAVAEGYELERGGQRASSASISFLGTRNQQVPDVEKSGTTTSSQKWRGGSPPGTQIVPLSALRQAYRSRGNGFGQAYTTGVRPSLPGTASRICENTGSPFLANPLSPSTRTKTGLSVWFSRRTRRPRRSVAVRVSLTRDPVHWSSFKTTSALPGATLVIIKHRGPLFISTKKFAMATPFSPAAGEDAYGTGMCGNEFAGPVFYLVVKVLPLLLTGCKVMSRAEATNLVCYLGSAHALQAESIHPNFWMCPPIVSGHNQMHILNVR